MPRHSYKKISTEDTFMNSYVLRDYDVKNCGVCKLLKKKHPKTFKLCSDCTYAQKHK